MVFSKRRSAAVKSVLLLTLAACAAVRCPAQMEPPVVSQDALATRSIQGVVLSDKGVPVPGAIVLLKNMKTLQVRSYIARNDGKYHFYGLSVDISYQLRAENSGLTSKTKNVSVFDSHKLITVNLKLVKKLKT
jgi:hypothetical protein